MDDCDVCREGATLYSALSATDLVPAKAGAATDVRSLLLTKGLRCSSTELIRAPSQPVCQVRPSRRGLRLGVGARFDATSATAKANVPGATDVLMAHRTGAPFAGESVRS